MKTEQTAKTDNGGNETKVPKTARRPKNYRISKSRSYGNAKEGSSREGYSGESGIILWE